VAFWLIVGLVPQSANALADAGFCSLADLADATREQLLAIPGVGPRALTVLEEVLDRPLPRRGKPRKATITPPQRPWPEDVWRKRGLPPSAALTFAIERMTLARLSGLSRKELLAMTGIGVGALEICELMVGHKLP
jgi:hypothetical protein